MIFDSHIHTRFSADSDLHLEFAIMEAANKGIGIVFTDHYDPDFPGDVDFTFDRDKYFEDYVSYSGSKVRLGVEAGMREDTLPQVKDFVTGGTFDLTIGSLHVMDGKDIYEEDFFKGKEKTALYNAYLEEMEKLVRSHGDFIDVLGHIDYICRQAPYAEPDLTYGEFSAAIDRVLRAVIETDTTLELSTRRFDNKQAVKELFPIYKRYYDLGGRYVTMGSDAHTQDAIGAHFVEAERFVREAGLTIVTYREHRMQVCWIA